MRVLVAYDGTMQTKAALSYGAQKVKENGGLLVALHVFNSNMFIDYDVFGAEETGQEEAMRLAEEARHILGETGKDIRTRLIVTEGNPEEETINYARENYMDLLLCPPGYKSIIRSFRKLKDEQGKKVYEDTIFDEMEKPMLSVLSQL
jgi:nucleotide-binding universal stress UspA family protein